MGGLPESFIEIDDVLVDRRIFTTHFICDVVLQNCGSACCHRGCIMTSDEIERIRPHMDGIVKYLPQAKRDFLAQEKGDFVAGSTRQDPDIWPEERWAMIRFFKTPDEMECTWVVDDECVFLYPAVKSCGEDGRPVPVHSCAVHSYALHKGLDWQTFKQTDCVQYPLCTYRRNGRTVLALQDDPGHAQVPCLNNHIGPLMYRSLSGTITYLLGPAFNERVEAYGREHFPD
jgi:uncharacterized protein DUF3109